MHFSVEQFLMKQRSMWLNCWSFWWWVFFPISTSKWFVHIYSQIKIVKVNNDVKIFLNVRITVCLFSVVSMFFPVFVFTLIEWRLQQPAQTADQPTSPFFRLMFNKRSNSLWTSRSTFPGDKRPKAECFRWLQGEQMLVCQWFPEGTMISMHSQHKGISFYTQRTLICLGDFNWRSPHDKQRVKIWMHTYPCV